jgi:hypothetical protein
MPSDAGRTFCDTSAGGSVYGAWAFTLAGPRPSRVARYISDSRLLRCERWRRGTGLRLWVGPFWLRRVSLFYPLVLTQESGALCGRWPCCSRGNCPGGGSFL